MKKLFSIVLITSYWLLVTASLAYALPLVPCGGTGQPDCNVCHFFVLIQRVVNFLTEAIAMPVAVIILIYGGIMLLTSGGSPEKINKGKSALWHAVWGLLIVFAAWLIIDTIIKWLAVGEGQTWLFGPWNAIPTSGCQ